MCKFRLSPPSTDGPFVTCGCTQELRQQALATPGAASAAGSEGDGDAEARCQRCRKLFVANKALLDRVAMLEGQLAALRGDNTAADGAARASAVAGFGGSGSSSTGPPTPGSMRDLTLFAQRANSPRRGAAGER